MGFTEFVHDYSGWLHGLLVVLIMVLLVLSGVVSGGETGKKAVEKLKELGDVSLGISFGALGLAVILWLWGSSSGNPITAKF